MDIDANSSMFSLNGRNVEHQVALLLSKNVLKFLGLGIADKQIM
jgi:hypothetical protein